MNAKRKKSSFKERTTPCLFCDYPISEQHHMFQLSEYQQNSLTTPLCSNCHDLYHIFDAAYKGSKRALKLLAHLMASENEQLYQSIAYAASFVLIHRANSEPIEFSDSTPLEMMEFATRQIPHIWFAYQVALREKRDPS